MSEIERSSKTIKAMFPYRYSAAYIARLHALIGQDAPLLIVTAEQRISNEAHTSKEIPIERKKIA